MRSPWKPATISSAASAGIGTRSTSGAASSTMTATNSPTKMLLQRDLAPALMISAVPETDPPAGMPPTKPVAMLAAPCPRKSRDTSGYLPSGLGVPWLTPAPWTRPMMATEKAGSSIDRTSDG